MKGERMIHRLEGDAICIEVESRGAQLKSIVVDQVEYLWQRDPKYWGEASPVLFPYIGRMVNKTYQTNGKRYQMDIHGFAKDMPFQLVEKDERKMVLEIEATADTLKQYPYDFKLQVIYLVEDNMLTTSYKIMNRGSEDMYYGIGGHPGIALPFEEGSVFEDYYIDFGKTSYPARITFSDAGFVDGRRDNFSLRENRYLDLKHTLFDRDAVVLENVNPQFLLTSKKGKRGIEFGCHGFSYIGFWHMPHTKAGYVCIEPWSSLPSREGICEILEQKSDLKRLSSQKIGSYAWWLKFV